MARWGLIPSWAKDPAIGNKLANARGETLAEKPSFRSAWATRRGLLPADGFYEWQKIAGAKAKQPWFITLVDDAPFAIGAIWETWRAPEGDPLLTCSVITVASNVLRAPIHARMPVIVPRASWARWLGDGDSRAGVPPSPLVASYPADEMTAWRVSTLVNAPSRDEAQCVVPLGA